MSLESKDATCVDFLCERANSHCGRHGSTNKLGKMLYVELVEFSSWLTVIDSQHKCPLNLMICISFSLMIISLASEGQQLENGKHFQEIPSISLSTRMYCILGFVLCDVNTKLIMLFQVLHRRFQRNLDILVLTCKWRKTGNISGNSLYFFVIPNVLACIVLGFNLLFCEVNTKLTMLYQVLHRRFQRNSDTIVRTCKWRKTWRWLSGIKSKPR